MAIGQGNRQPISTQRSDEPMTLGIQVVFPILWIEPSQAKIGSSNMD